MAKASEVVAGFFDTRGEGEAAQQALLSSGFSRHEVSFLAGDTSGHETPAIGPVEQIGAEDEAGNDALVGGMLGLAAGAFAGLIPGIGPLIALGPLAAALGVMEGGIAAGSIIGILRDHGISDDEAQFYAEGVKNGGSLVTVRNLPKERADQARNILKTYGAIDSEDLTKDAG